VWFKNVINAYALQKMEEAGKHINTFKERLRYSYWVGYLKERGINIHFFKSL
jgi:hypothetical protein